VFWSGGEIPTTPGKAYTLKLSADKAMTWIPAMAGRGNVYPLGQAYFGSEARPFYDLGFMLGEENDNRRFPRLYRRGTYYFRLRLSSNSVAGNGSHPCPYRRGTPAKLEFRIWRRRFE
jgi:hypothetical protein